MYTRKVSKTPISNGTGSLMPFDWKNQSSGVSIGFDDHDTLETCRIEHPGHVRVRKAAIMGSTFEEVNEDLVVKNMIAPSEEYGWIEFYPQRHEPAPFATHIPPRDDH